MKITSEAPFNNFYIVLHSQFVAHSYLTEDVPLHSL